jgi:hypothetical protein
VHNCACTDPIRVERAERKGASRTHCARGGKPVPLRLVPPRPVRRAA